MRRLYLDLAQGFGKCLFHVWMSLGECETEALRHLSQTFGRPDNLVSLSDRTCL